MVWNHDGINRLTREKITGAPRGKSGTLEYGLDPVGNRTSSTSTISGLAPISGTFNYDDELTSEGYDALGDGSRRQLHHQRGKAYCSPTSNDSNGADNADIQAYVKSLGYPFASNLTTSTTWLSGTPSAQTTCGTGPS